MLPKNQIYIGLSTNLGDKIQNLTNAKKQLQKNKINIINESSIYKTEAWGYEKQPEFFNQIIQISTNLNPNQLLTITQKIEKKLGKITLFKFGPRIIDIDILYYNNQIIHEPNLKIPHPQNQNRNFILVPLNQIATDFIDPITNNTIYQLLQKCQDTKKVSKI